MSFGVASTAPCSSLLLGLEGDAAAITLGDDFRDIRATVLGEGEKRTIADMRRSGTIEAKRGGATKEAIGEKLGNAFATSKFINDTYGSTVVQIVRQVDDARRRARTKKWADSEQKLDVSNFSTGRRHTSVAYPVI